MVLRLLNLQASDTKLETFLHKNQHTQRKLLNFEKWCMGMGEKVPKFNFLTSKIIVSQFFFSLKNTNLRTNFCCYWHFSIIPIFKSLYFLKWCPIFDSLPPHQFAKFNDFLLSRLVFRQFFSDILSLNWKSDNPYYHNYPATI